MGFLDRLYYAQALQHQQPALTPLAPAPSPLAGMGKPPAPPQTFMQRLNGALSPEGEDGGLFSSPLLLAGLSLLGNSRNGGDWGAVGRDLMGISQQQQQQRLRQRTQQREDVADRRANTQFKWQAGEQERQGQTRQAFDAEVARLQEIDPVTASQLRAVGPDGYPDWVQQQQRTQFEHERASVADRQWGAEMGLRREGMALDALRVNRSQYLRGPDRSLMEDVRTASGSANELLSLAQMFRAANGRTGTGGGSQFIPFSADRASMRQVGSIMRGMMRPVGSGATSDYEQRLYAMGVPSVDLLGTQNQAIINNVETLAQLRNGRRYFYEDWAEQHGSLNGAEQAFQASPEFQQIRARNPIREPDERPSASGSSGDRAQTFSALPPPRGYREGQSIVDEETGTRFVIRNGQWARVAVISPQQSNNGVLR